MTFGFESASSAHGHGGAWRICKFEQAFESKRKEVGSRISPPLNAGYALAVEGAFAFSNEIVTSHMVIISLRVTYPDPSTRGAFRRRLVGGDRERHLRAMGDATSSPGRTRAASSGTMDPARSDHGQRHKGQDAALARRKAWRCIAMHLIVRSNPDTRPE